jgi:uncharacterized protein YlbG (UPF0298 family)
MKMVVKMGDWYVTDWECEYGQLTYNTHRDRYKAVHVTVEDFDDLFNELGICEHVLVIDNALMPIKKQ